MPEERTAYFCDCCNEAQPYHRNDCPGGVYEAVQVVPAEWVRPTNRL